jgi:hypothetical protein
MALSIDAIFAPLNQFFLSKFGSAQPQTEVIFRFDKIGSVISDADFIDENHADLGYLPALAIEKFSDLVNRVPVDLGDGSNVLLSQNSIDATYFYRMVSSALPYVAPGTADPDAQALTDAFNAEKAKAIRLWNSIDMASLTGLMMEYKPSLATPERWYDSNQTDAWTSQRFEISQPADQPDPPPADTRLWRLRPSAEILATAVASPPPPAVTMPHVGFSRMLGQADTFQRSLSPQMIGDLLNPTVSPTVDRPIRTLNIRDRLQLVNAVADHIPTQPATTQKIVIAFDYCLVDISRPWMLDVFLNSGNWYVPGVEQGALNRPDAAGGMALLPIGMVVIRNLVITASWDADDIANSAAAIAFGPFKTDGGIVDGSLKHQSIQTIGWMLQQLPPLPPNQISPSS